MELSEFFAQNRKVAIAFSGGTDSAFLAYEAKKSGCEIIAFFAQTEFTPKWEVKSAKRFCQKYQIPLKVIKISVLNNSDISKNNENRCYFCKKLILGKIKEKANLIGFEKILDGTNFSDNVLARPGFRAVKEFGVISPLKECGFEKEKIRLESKAENLCTWTYPSYSCLATRINQGQKISRTKLKKVEKSENFLFDLKFTDTRVRISENQCGKIDAKIELKKEERKIFCENQKKIEKWFGKNFSKISFDWEARNGRN